MGESDTDRLSYIRWVTDIGVRPWGICQSEEFAFISNSGENTVAKIDKGTKQLVGAPFSVAGLNAPHGIAYDSEGYFWVAFFGDGKVQKYDSTTGEPQINGWGGGVVVGSRPEGITVSYEEDIPKIWVACSGDDTVWKLNKNGTYAFNFPGNIHYVKVGKRPIGIAVDKNGNAYLACRDSKRVYKIDKDGNHQWRGIDYRDDFPDDVKIIKRGVFVGHSPIGIAIDDAQLNESEWRVYVTNEVTHNLSILRATDGKHLNTINLGIRRASCKNIQGP